MALRDISDYSTSGSTTTFKGGVNWKPVKALRLRGSYAEGFRAPQIGELFGTQSRFDQTISDPCSNDSTAPLNSSNDPTVTGQLHRARRSRRGSYQQANPQISVIVGGNEDLKPETSKSWIFGGVFSPAIIPGPFDRSESLQHQDQGRDPVGRRQRDADQLRGLATIRCLRARHAVPAQRSADPDRGLLQNIAGINTEGIDLNLAYRTRRTDVGNASASRWNNTFLHKFDVITADGDRNPDDQAAPARNRAAPTQAFPKLKSIGIIDWDLGGFGATLTGRYISKLSRERLATCMNSRMSTPTSSCAGRRSCLNHLLGLAVGVNNLFNVRIRRAASPAISTTSTRRPTIFRVASITRA